MYLFVSLRNICACDFGLSKFIPGGNLCECVRVCLTDAGAEVSVFSVTPMVVGITVVAAHRLQLDLLDLHSLCDGRVGSGCRCCCQAWGGEVGET